MTQGKLKANAKNRLHSDLGLASKNIHDEVCAQTTLSFQHNRGHAGHKYNEMADPLAKLGVESSTNMATRLHPLPRVLAEGLLAPPIPAECNADYPAEDVVERGPALLPGGRMYHPTSDLLVPAGRDGPRRNFEVFAGALGSTKGVPRQHLLQNYGNLHKMF